MSEQLQNNDELSATLPGFRPSWAEAHDLPEIEGVPTEPQALMTSDGQSVRLDLDLELDFDLDLAYANDAVNQQAHDSDRSGSAEQQLATEPTHLQAWESQARPVNRFEEAPKKPKVKADVKPAVIRQPIGGFSVDAGQTFTGTSGFPWQDGRVLVVSADLDERVYLRARLALAKLVWVDEATTTTQAQVSMKAHRYTMAIFNLDVPVIDGLALVKQFRHTYPDAVCVVTGSASPKAGPLGFLSRWRQWQREKELLGTGVEWLVKPWLPAKISQLFARVENRKRKSKAQH